MHIKKLIANKAKNVLFPINSEALKNACLRNTPDSWTAMAMSHWLSSLYLLASANFHVSHFPLSLIYNCNLSSIQIVRGWRHGRGVELPHVERFATWQLPTRGTRAGNETSRSLRFHNHEAGPRAFFWLKSATTLPLDHKGWWAVSIVS